MRPKNKVCPNVLFKIGDDANGEVCWRLSQLLYEVASRPRQGGITLAQMDRWLPVMRLLREQPDDLLHLPVEHWEMLREDLAVFPFARPDEAVRAAVRAFMDATEETDMSGVKNASG